MTLSDIVTSPFTLSNPNHGNEMHWGKNRSNFKTGNGLSAEETG